MGVTHLAALSSSMVDMLSLAQVSLPQPISGHVVRAKAGDGAGFRALYEVHARRVYSLSLRLSGRPAAAEKLTQDIFLDAFSHLDDIGGDEEFAALLYGQAVKKALAMHFNGGSAVTAGQHLSLDSHLTGTGQNGSATHSG